MEVAAAEVAAAEVVAITVVEVAAAAVVEAAAVVATTVVEAWAAVVEAAVAVDITAVADTAAAAVETAVAADIMVVADTMAAAAEAVVAAVVVVPIVYLQDHVLSPITMEIMIQISTHIPTMDMKPTRNIIPTPIQRTIQFLLHSMVLAIIQVRAMKTPELVRVAAAVAAR